MRKDTEKAEEEKRERLLVSAHQGLLDLLSRVSPILRETPPCSLHPSLHHSADGLGWVLLSLQVEHEQLEAQSLSCTSAALGPGVEGRTECQAGRLARGQTSGWTSRLADRQANEQLEKQPQG